MTVPKYRIEFVLHAHEDSFEPLKGSLSEFGEHVNISESASCASSGRDYNVSLVAEEPTQVFDVCAQFGRIRSIKIEEES